MLPNPPPVEPPNGEKKKKFILGDTEVTLVQKHIQFLDRNGKLITESLIDYTKRNVLRQYASLDDFLAAWNDAERKQAVVDELENHGVFFDALYEDVGKDLDPL